MKITAIDTAVLRIPTRKPIALDFPHHSLVVAHIRTDEGVTGLGLHARLRRRGRGVHPGLPRRRGSRRC